MGVLPGVLWDGDSSLAGSVFIPYRAPFCPLGHEILIKVNIYIVLFPLTKPVPTTLQG